MRVSKKSQITYSCGIALFIILLAVNLLTTENKLRNSTDADENRKFWTYNYLTNEYREVDSQLLAIGDWCYIYMEKECISALGEAAVRAKSDAIGTEFDTVIYPRIIDLAGHPNGTMGDIDGDPKIFILFYDGYNYYSEVNDIEYNVSNQCEMLYISYRLYYHNWLFPTIAHEFHHLIWFNNEWDEPPFTLEALAQYATYHAGYLGPYDNLVPQVAFYLPHPENSPLYWNDDRDYGSTYLFAFYLAEKYGVEILRDLIHEPADGPQGIEVTLQKAGYNITFNALFMNWLVALTLDQLGFQNNLFGFEGLDARIISYEVGSIPSLTNQTISIGHYAFQILRVESPPDNFTVTIKKHPQHAVGISIAAHDSSGWLVQQSLHYEERNTITDSFSGSQIDEAFIITSYISKNTPTAPQERGSGPSTNIEITLTQGAQYRL
ncbi:MAG: hypothetical protein ACFFGZ_00865 [Candidatus Thorarchaeota archaeon]